MPICLCETKIIGNGIDRAIHVGSIFQSIKKLRKTCEQISSNHRIVIAYHEKIFSSPRQQPAGISRICLEFCFFSPGNETKQKIEVVNQMKNENKIRKEEYQTIRTGIIVLKNMYV